MYNLIARSKINYLFNYLKYSHIGPSNEKSIFFFFKLHKLSLTYLGIIGAYKNYYNFLSNVTSWIKIILRMAPKFYFNFIIFKICTHLINYYMYSFKRF